MESCRGVSCGRCGIGRQVEEFDDEVTEYHRISTKVDHVEWGLIQLGISRFTERRRGELVVIFYELGSLDVPKEFKFPRPDFFEEVPTKIFGVHCL